MRKGILLFACVAIAIVLAAGARSRLTRPALPATGPAPQAAPSRIVSLVPAVTEMLFAMGAGDRLIGVGSYDRFPPEVERIPKVGGLLDPNIERIISMRPDLVVVYGTQDDLRHQLEASHIAQYVYVHKGLADITAMIRDLGVRLGAPRAADVAAGMDARLAAIRARVAAVPRRRTLIVFGREQGSLRNINASGGVGFLHDMLEAAGGDNVMADVKRESAQLGTEAVLSRAPDVILELHYGASLQGARFDTERAVWSGLPAVPAVRTGRVYLLAGDEFVVPGPRVVDAIERLSRTLHPESW